VPAWKEDAEQASVIEGCLRYVHSLGSDGARDALKTRHIIVISEIVARDFHNQSAKCLRVFRPKLVVLQQFNTGWPRFIFEKNP